MSYKNLRRSVINAPNLFSLGAIIVSIADGKYASSAIFGLGAIFGAHAKYKTREAEEKGETLTSKTWFERNILHNPKITTQFFIASASTAALQAAYTAFTEPEKAAIHGLNSIAWGFAALGDNALRRLDGQNFDQGTSPKGSGKFSEMFNRFSRWHNSMHGKYRGYRVADEMLKNPMAPFSIFELNFGVAMLSASLAMTGTAATIATTASISVIGLSVGAFSYAGYKAYQKIHNPDRATDKPIDNFMAIGAKCALAVSAFLTGSYVLGAAQTLFLIGNGVMIYEQREASKRESAAQKPTLTA